MNANRLRQLRPLTQVPNRSRYQLVEAGATPAPASTPSIWELRRKSGRRKSIILRSKSGLRRRRLFGNGPKRFGKRFQSGRFVLHLASPLSQKVSYFAEVSFTAQPNNTYELSVERTIIRYDYNDYFKLSFGKYHTPIGYWNTAFHHGAWLQTTIARPEMVKFGGTFIPVHFVGVQAEGNIPSGGLGLGYNLGIGNGRSSNFSKAGDSGDVNDNRAWVANLFARPTRLYGLEVGGSSYRDKLTPNPGTNFDEWIASGYVVWNKQRPELLAEYANVHHRDLQTSQTFNTTSYYVQLAYRLPWQVDKWKPYYRFEYIPRPGVEPVWDRTGAAAW